MIYYGSKLFWLIAAPTSALVSIAAIAACWAVLHGPTYAAWLAAAAACGLAIAAFTPIGVAFMVPLENRFAFSLSDSKTTPVGIIVLAGHGAGSDALEALRQRFPFRSIAPIHRNVKPRTLKGPSKSCNHLEATNGFANVSFIPFASDLLPVRIPPVG